MISANQAHQPITEDDAFLAHVVEDIGLVQLLCSVVHMTGSLDIIDAVRTKPARYNGDGSGQIPETEAARLRARALEAIKTWRDAGQPEPYRPSPTEFNRMFDVLAGTAMGPDYGPVVRDEMGYDGDSRRYIWPSDVSARDKQDNPVLIIGAGMSGLLMAYRLQQAGIPTRIIEKNPGLGGTWHENRYPGARVDVASHSYSFSFTQEYKWPTLYAPQPELERYFNTFADRFGLRELIYFESEVVQAAYDEQACEWRVVVRGPDGGERTERARSLISAVGQLNRAHIPDLPGLDSFSGRYWHTSNWPDDADLTGKNVVFVGAAATGVQAIPQVAQVAAHTTVVMRSSNWMTIHPEYTREIRDTEQWAFEHLPYYAGWTRTLYFNWPFDMEPKRFKIDPDWKGGEPGKLSTSEANELSRINLTRGIERFLADTPELIAKVVPDYPPYMKRPNVIDGSFLRALQQDNVSLVDGVEQVTPQGVVDRDGKLHRADVIVFATGFLTQKFLHPMEIRGRGGQTLNDYWGDEPAALYGVTVPNFPNFYLMYGPNTNLGFNGTLIFNSECQARYIIGNIGRMIAEGLNEIEARQSAHDAYDAKVQQQLQDFVWTLDHTTNWFKNSKGRITTNSPWSCSQYWRFTLNPNPEDYLKPGERQEDSESLAASPPRKQTARSRG